MTLLLLLLVGTFEDAGLSRHYEIGNVSDEAPPTTAKWLITNLDFWII